MIMREIRLTECATKVTRIAHGLSCKEIRHGMMETADRADTPN